MSMADLAHKDELGPGLDSFMALARLDQAALDTLPQAVYLCAGDGRLVRFNDKAVELWGRTPHLSDPQERFCGSLRLYRTDGSFLPHEQCPMAAALQTGESFKGQEVVIERPDGGRRTVLVNIAPFKDQDGRVNGAINCFQDISDRKQAELQQRQLIQELNHRVKNTLATVQSMATFTARDAESLDDFMTRFGGRLEALGRAQALLSACERDGASLRDLLAQQLEPFRNGTSARVGFEGPDIDLQSDLAFPLCMVFHELMTNAAKYGPLSVDGGRISIKWDVRPGAEHRRTLTLDWVEAGGPPVKSPERAGFGTQLIRRVIAGLRGEADLRFEPSGLRLSARVPIGNEEGSPAS